MLGLVRRWLVTAVLLVFVVTVLTFVLVSLTPGDAARRLLGLSASAQQIDHLREQLGLNASLPEQYWNWLSGAVQGDLGTSLLNGESVTHILNQRLEVTLSLIAGALSIATVVGVGLGLVAARRRGAVRRGVDALSLIGVAVPPYWLGLVLVAVFAVELKIFPPNGYTSIFDSPLEWAESLFLPIVTLGLGGSAIIAKQTRDAVLREMGRPYVIALRARGLTARSILLRHVLRNAAIPVVTVMGILVVGLLGGTILVESVFVMPGLGGQAASATGSHDIPVLLGVALYFTLIVVIVSLVVEIVYGVLDPRVRR
jgi:peptide/nickel transport system permease protein